MNSDNYKIGSSRIFKADIRPSASNCWRCSGLESYWPVGHSTEPTPCGVCAHSGLEMIPWSELFNRDVKLRRRTGFQNVKLWGASK